MIIFLKKGLGGVLHAFDDEGEEALHNFKIGDTVRIGEYEGSTGFNRTGVWEFYYENGKLKDFSVIFHKSNK